MGFKNGTDGNISVAVDAIRAASSGHHFLSVTKQGLSAIVETKGNNCCHVILRGGQTGPNYDYQSISNCVEILTKAGKRPTVMIDCSHGNSQKKHEKQLLVIKDIYEQLSDLKPGCTKDAILGVMIESHLVAGRQNLTENMKDLVYGQSITDACLGWEDTVRGLNELRKAVQNKRQQL